MWRFMWEKHSRGKRKLQRPLLRCASILKLSSGILECAPTCHCWALFFYKRYEVGLERILFKLALLEMCGFSPSIPPDIIYSLSLYTQYVNMFGLHWEECALRLPYEISRPVPCWLLSCPPLLMLCMLLHQYFSHNLVVVVPHVTGQLWWWYCNSVPDLLNIRNPRCLWPSHAPFCWGSNAMFLEQ